MRRKTMIISLAMFLFLFTQNAFTQTKISGERLKEIFEDLNSYAQKGMKEYQIPGMAIGVVKGNDLIYSKGFGVKKIGTNDEVAADTIFQIGSTSKAFTAALVSMLEDEGKFSWDDKVVELLPDFMLYDPWVTREFMVSDLMAQHSGLPEHALDTPSFLGYSRADIRHALRFVKPASSFRLKYAYQNCLFLFASRLIEETTKKSWEDNIRERIFIPLGMNDSSVDMQSFTEAKNAAYLHIKKGEEVQALGMDWPYMDWVYTYAPAGGINSNIKDMVKWLSFQINEGSVSGKELISRKNMNFMHSPKTITDMDFNGHRVYYCEAWIYMENEPYPIIWHNGGTSGMKTMIAFIPQEKIGIVILSNLITGFPEDLAFRFFDNYFGKPLKDNILASVEKQKNAQANAKAQFPKKPAQPIESLALDKYEGVYVNDVYGKINVSVLNDGLIITIGPKNIQFILTRWDRSVFLTQFSDFDSGDLGSFASFEVGPDEIPVSLTIDSLNADGSGVFKYQPKEQKGI